MANYQYPINPSATTGSGTIFGKVPGPISLPQPAQDLATAAPGVAGLGGTISKTLSDRLGGQISPGTQAALQDAAARYGMNIGQAGLSPLAYHNLFANLAGFAENQASQAIQEYGPFVGAVSGTQTVRPELQAQIAEENALKAAAPDPTAAQSHAENLFASYLAATRGPGGGTRSITPSAVSSGFGTPDQVYQSMAPGEYYGGQLMETPPTVSVPRANLQAGGPNAGTGSIYSGPTANYEDPSLALAEFWGSEV